MAYNVTPKFREKCYSGSSLYDCLLTINDYVVPYAQIESIKISDPIVDSEQDYFYIGTFIAKKIVIQFKNFNNLNIKSGNRVDLSIIQFVEDDWEIVPIGKFLIDDLSENYQETCKITCLDYSIKFKSPIDYSPCFVNGKASIDTILVYICNYFEIEIGEFPQTNGNVEVGSYDSTISGKLWISYIAEIKGCNAKMDRYGRLTLIPIKREPVTTIDALQSELFEIGDTYRLSRLVFDNGLLKVSIGETKNDSSVLATEKNEPLLCESGEMISIGNAHNTLYIRQDNPFVIGSIEGEDNPIQKIFENIYEVVKDFEITNIKVRNYGDISLDGYDIIAYDYGGRIYNTFYQPEFTYSMTIMLDSTVKMPTKQQEETTNVNDSADETQNKARVRKLETNIDTINNQFVLKATADGKIAIVKIGADAEKGSEFEIKADSIRLEGFTSINNGFKIDLDGNMEATSGKIGGFDIGIKALSCEIKPDYDYNQSDIDKVRSFLQGQTTLTDEEKRKYDLNKNGNVGIDDLNYMQKLITYNVGNSYPAKFMLDTQDWNMPLKFINGSGETLVGLGLSGLYTKDI